VKRPELAELWEQLDLVRDKRSALEGLVQMLARDPTAPTSITDPDEAAAVHIADSLSVLPLVGSLLADRLEGEAIVDIGSGAGFPGLPLAVALGGSSVDLIESMERKCRFISRAIDQLELRNARVVCMRAEDWAGGEGENRYQLAVARAVAALATLVEYASPLLTEGGFLIAWKGRRDGAEERSGNLAARRLGMQPQGVHPVVPFPGSRRRHLHVFEKHEPTPPGIPRRAGMARKRPLGGE
jgi:16S rRNA (guanine527-N7)-methyltransferase